MAWQAATSSISHVLPASFFMLPWGIQKRPHILTDLGFVCAPDAPPYVFLEPWKKMSVLHLFISTLATIVLDTGS
jgi:hypothetical protein